VFLGKKGMRPREWRRGGWGIQFVNERELIFYCFDVAYG
jgi:hypothetical protein